MSSSKSSSSEAPPCHEFTVRPEDAGQRLDSLLALHPAITSRQMALRLIASGAVRVNARPERPAARMRAGDAVAFSLPPPTAATVSAQAGRLDVLYEDASLAVINKPPGMPMHPGPGHATDTLVNYLLHHCRDLSGIGGERRPGIVHRLDKDTSGVVVVAKNDAAHLGLAEQFKAHSVARSYLAVVIGHPKRKTGKIDLPLGRSRKNRLKRAVASDGKRAVTHWRVLAEQAPFCLLGVTLETGRTHQIRVHLAEQGWPVVCDPLYGGARHKGLALADPLQTLLGNFRRQALHAAELGFVHPAGGEPLQFSAPPPADMRELLAALGLA